jgi:hypothetical protein
MKGIKKDGGDKAFDKGKSPLSPFSKGGDTGAASLKDADG